MCYNPEIILAGRRLNDGIRQFVASELVRLMIGAGHKVQGTKCLILGFTFKENCPDVRNTRVIEIVLAINAFHMEPMVYDPWANPEEVMHEYGITVYNQLPQVDFGAAILAVAHMEFESFNVREILPNEIIYDVKGVLPKEQVDARL